LLNTIRCAIVLSVTVDGQAFYEALGRRIRTAREEQSMTQAQLGARLAPPVTRASIANVEAGKQRVLVHTLVQIARVLRTPIDHLTPAPDATPAQVSDAIEQELRYKLSLPPVVMGRLTKAVRRGARRIQRS
jgi:transcriptional regulator with XRE-family HTH domain